MTVLQIPAMCPEAGDGTTRALIEAAGTGMGAGAGAAADWVARRRRSGGCPRGRTTEHAAPGLSAAEELPSTSSRESVRVSQPFALRAAFRSVANHLLDLPADAVSKWLGEVREARSETDWARLLPDVARRLLGEPPRNDRSGDTWRYGTHGSMAVHVGGNRAGSWRNFETGESGGTLDLVQHVLQCDKAAALRWLEDEGLIERRTAHGDGRDRAQASASVSAPRATPRQPQPSKTAHLAAAILRAAVPADDTPARRYLARRWTWPLVGMGPDLPTTVRYIDAGDMPEGRRKDGTPYRLLPAAAAGCVVFVLTDPAGKRPPAVSL